MPGDTSLPIRGLTEEVLEGRCGGSSNPQHRGTGTHQWVRALPGAMGRRQSSSCCREAAAPGRGGGEEGGE